MKILLTGATGSVGKSITPHQGLEIIKVSSKDADLTNFDETKKLILKIKPDSIIHLAALSGGRQLNVARPADLLTHNLNMAQNLIEAANVFSIKRIGIALSGACYGAEVSYLAKENEFHKFALESEDFAYGYAKRMLEVFMRAYNLQFNMDIYCFVINGVIGLNMNFAQDKALMIPSLIQKAYKSAKTGDNLEVWGDGTPQRQYTWERDIARNILWCHKNQERSTILNIGTNEVVTVAHCAKLICQNFGIDESQIKFNLEKGNGKLLQLTDNSQFVHLSNLKFQDIEVSLEKACDYFKKTFF